MRTSSKWIFAAFVLLLLSMALYDGNLVGNFLTGHYKVPFSNYVPSPITGFRHIDLRSASTINIQIEKGPFRVLTEPSASEYVRFHQHGDTLEIETIFPDQYRNEGYDFAMYISCPELSSIRSDARYHIGSRDYLDVYANEYFNYRKTTISGFTQDSLLVTANHASNIWLTGDHIGYLQASIGIDSASTTNFLLGNDNHFDRTKIDIGNTSRFYIKEVDSVQTLHYTLSDSAKLILSGRVQHILQKQP